MITIKMIHKNPEIHNSVLSYSGTFSVDNCSIPFTMSVDQWSLQDYTDQWNKGLERLRSHDTSCLVLNVGEHQLSSDGLQGRILKWLVLYKNKENVVTIQRLRFLDELYNTYIGTNMSITKENCYEFIPEYKPYYPIASILSDVSWKLDEKDLDKNFKIEMWDELLENHHSLIEVTGAITIGTYEHHFKVPITYWDIDVYKKQWKEALAYLKDHNTTCFITRILSPTGVLARWLVYKKNGKITFYYDYFDGERHLENAPEGMTRENCYNFIPTEQEQLEKYRVKECVVPMLELNGIEVVWPKE